LPFSNGNERIIMQQPIDTSTAQLGRDCAAGPPATQYLSFRLGGLEYGLDIRKVQELRPLTALRRFSSDGEIISGVAVLRDVILPMVDMRIAFSGDTALPDTRTDVIILQLSHCVIGMVVDAVTDIVAIGADAIRPIAGAGPEAGYLLGLGEVDGRRLILVDIDRLLSDRSSAGTRPAPPAVRAAPATLLRVAPGPS
jgi:purine-binding chemotaxis protein CheW